VAGNQNARIAPHADVDFGDFGIAVRRGVGLVQQGHGVDGAFARPQDQRDHLLHAQISGGGDQRFPDEIMNFFVLEVQHGGVLGVCGNSLEAIEQKHTQRAHILIFCGKNADAGRFLFKFLHMVGMPHGSVMQVGGQCRAAGCLKFAAKPERLPDHSDDPFAVEVGIGDRGKKRFHDEASVFGIQRPFFFSLVGSDGHAAQ